MKNKIAITILLITMSVTAFGQSLFKQGVTAFENEQYDVAIEHFTEIISNNHKLTFYSENKISRIYYYRAASLNKLNKNESLVINDLEKSIKVTPFFEALELYSEVANQSSSDVISVIKFVENENREYNNYYYFIVSVIYAKSDDITTQLRSFDYLNKSLKNGYNVTSKIVEYRELFGRINSDTYFSILRDNGIMDSHTVLIKNYVEKRTNQWQNKGKFEKTETYQKRVNEVSRNETVKYYTQYYIDSVGSQRIILENATNEYDADNEVFKIVFNNLNTLYIPVPINEAKNFDRNFKELLFTNSKFTFYNNKFELIHLDIVNPGTDKIYTFNSNDIPEFSSSLLALNFDDINIELENNLSNNFNKEGVNTINVGKSDIDVNIPNAQIVRKNTFALIIGNEDYKSYQTGLKIEQNVEFAVNDAEVFSKYCIKTLGIPEENIILETNIGIVRMKQVFNQINSIIKTLNGEAEIIIYYAGHGFPDETTKEPYLIPVDVSSNSLELAINLKDLYRQLTIYPSKRILIFLDACFTGGGRELGLLASRGVKIKPKENVLSGNLVVFSGSSGDQSALPYYEKGHGLFTYYLLKKIQESNGNLTLKELEEYLHKNVSIKSSIENNRVQNPHTNISRSIIDEWEEWKL